MKKLITLFVAALTSVTMLAGCAPKPQAASESQTSTSSSSASTIKKGGTLVAYASGDPVVFNPDTKADDNFFPIAQNIYNRLIKLNNDQEIVPDLAKTWTTSDDGKTVTFNLNKGIKWQDGVAFTSKDVKFTFDNIISQNGISKDEFTSVQDVTCPDDNTVVFHLKNPDATFLGYVAWYGTFIVPEHIFGNGNWDKGTSIKPVGTGPFKFVDWKAGVSITLEKNPDYFVQAPYLDKIQFSIIADPTTATQSFKNGELDIGTNPSGQDMKAMMKDPKYKAVLQAFPSRYYFQLNNKKGVFKDVKVRQAFAYALNNNEISQKATLGTCKAATSWFTPMYSWAIDPQATIPNNNQAKAKELLKEAGYPNGFTITAAITDSGFFKPITEVAKDELSKVGIKVNISSLEMNAWYNKLSQGDYDIGIYGGYQGPDIGCAASRIVSGGGNNLEGYANKKVDDLFTQALQLSTDAQKAERTAKYKEIQQILAQDVPFVPIAEMSQITPAQSYVMGDPVNDKSVTKKCGFSEYTYVWLNK